MYVLKSLGRYILGNSENSDLIQLSNCSLWQVEHKKNNIINRIRLLDECDATLRRAGGETPFEYELIIKESTIEGNSKTGNDGEEFFNFQVSYELDFGRFYDDDGAPVFRWTDNGKRYELVVALDTTAATVEMFHVIFAQCLYENVNRLPHSEAQDEEIQKLVIVQRPTTADESIGHSTSITGERVVFNSESCLFYVFDAASGIFTPKCDVPVTAIITGAKDNRSFYLNISRIENGVTVHRQLIDPDATLHTDRMQFSFIWCHFNDQGIAWTFSLRFANAVGLMGLSNAFGQVIYETLNNSKISEEDLDYFIDQFTTANIKMDSPPASDTESEEGVTTEDEPIEEITYRTPKSASSNRQLAVGFKNDRSFVTHGSSMSVFKHTDDDSIKLYANIESLKNSKGKKLLKPSKMMLHDEDRSMLMMDSTNPGQIYKLDLEYGKVVEDWTVHQDSAVTSIVPDFKYAQMTSNPTFIGLNGNSIFRVDPRLPGDKRVDAEMKQYVVKNDFTCGATTGQGELAVASGKGEIRLFNKLDKRAKTLLPGFGDPIIGIDVTESGKYIIATCKTYLLLICTEIPGEDSLGFTKSMGSNKAAPKRLQLKPEHISYMGAVSFTSARFSTGQSEERSIITSTGPYVVTWNLRRVKQGHLWDYQIRKYEDKVVADNFRYGQDRNIVVTLPHHVTMISKKSLASAPQLFGPNDHIVDSL